MSNVKEKIERKIYLENINGIIDYSALPKDLSTLKDYEEKMIVNTMSKLPVYILEAKRGELENQLKIETDELTKKNCQITIDQINKALLEKQEGKL
jgi:hypothetical protein